MKITEIEIRICDNKRAQMDTSALHGGKSDLEFLVITAKTDTGLEASTFGFAGRSGSMCGEIAANVLKPFFLGRNPLFREKHWHDFRVVDRWWNLVPIYAYGPFDILCWLLSAQDAGQPLYQYIGAYRDRVPVYASSLVLDTPEDYAKEAKHFKDQGWAAYKLHPPGRYDLDLEAYKLCREAVGPEFKLMADPVAAYSLNEALRMGRELEKLDYYWFEEPIADVHLSGLKSLKDKLDIPICGVEVLPGSHYSAAESIRAGAVDIVRTDVSWKGGITPVLKTAHLAESFGMQCELHTTIYHPLELVNLHCCAAIKNCEFIELLAPVDTFDFGLKESLRIENGEMILPDKPGLGIELDWDFIEQCTTKIL